MITKITSRHMELTDALKSYAEKKIAKISKFHNRLSEIEMILDSEGIESKVEIIVRSADHSKPFVVHCSNEDAYACLDIAIDKMERQIVKHKGKIHHNKGKAGAGEASADVLEAQIPIEENEAI